MVQSAGSDLAGVLIHSRRGRIAAPSPPHCHSISASVSLVPAAKARAPPLAAPSSSGLLLVSSIGACAWPRGSKLIRLDFLVSVYVRSAAVPMRHRVQLSRRRSCKLLAHMLPSNLPILLGTCPMMIPSVDYQTNGILGWFGTAQTTTGPAVSLLRTGRGRCTHLEVSCFLPVVQAQENTDTLFLCLGKCAILRRLETSIMLP
ncbi:hypothetical protein C8Q79DRAFT_961220 [Trametes meyenii]|nr:hypothetical protein C8Q79DRAFT_961220 [Trametes meyenii]